MILDLVYIPSRTLRKIAKPIDKINDEIITLANNMLETMYKNNGIGLAANQIGVLKRIFVTDVPTILEDETGEKIYQPNPMVFINPEIIKYSTETDTMNEGCLSIPSVIRPKVRPTSITIKYLNEHAQEKILQTDGLQARCIQHENDHINGVLFTDELSLYERRVKIPKEVKNYFMSLNKDK